MIAERLSAIFQALGLVEIDELRRLVRLLPPRAKVINLGNGAGTSAIAMCEAGTDCIVYSVGLQLSTCEHDEGIEFVKKLRLIQLTDGSQGVANYWDLGPVDLVFIDADHEYESCKADFQAWDPFLRVGGYMVFHDNNPVVFPGVVRFLEEVDAMPDRYMPISTLDVTRAFQKRS